jgi:electron transport complex protein RnfC
MIDSTVTSSNIKTLPIAINRVILPLDYNYATTGDLLVKIGEQVLQNQPLTKVLPDNNYCVAIHAPISGTITNIAEYYILQENYMNHSLKKIKAIEITTLSNEITDLKYTYPLQETKLPSLLNQFGIIGLGGAGFPSAKKLETKTISTLIINAVECENPIIADYGLMINHSANIIHGITILNQIIQAKSVIIAIKTSMTRAIKQMEQALTQYNTHQNNNTNIAIKLIPDQYPNGYSKTLIKLVTNQEITYNTHSSQNGIICLNVGTIFAIEQALTKQQPLINRIVTIGITKSKQTIYENYLIPIGTPISTILLAFNIDFTKIENKTHFLKITTGGNHMGYTIFDSTRLTQHQINYEYLNNVGIEKTTQIITITYQEIPNKQPSLFNKLLSFIKKNSKAATECIKCGFCEPVCPMNLMPQQLYWFSQNTEQSDNFKSLEEHYIHNCIECGLCDTVCPSNLPLAAKFKHAKSKVKIANYKITQAELAKQRNEQTTARIHTLEEVVFEQSNNIINASKYNKKNILESALKRAQQKKQIKSEISQ